MLVKIFMHIIQRREKTLKLLSRSNQIGYLVAKARAKYKYQVRRGRGALRTRPRTAEENGIAYQNRKKQKHNTNNTTPGPVGGGRQGCKLYSSPEGNTSSELQVGRNHHRGTKALERPQPQQAPHRPCRTGKNSKQSCTSWEVWENKVVCRLIGTAPCRCWGRTEVREHLVTLLEELRTGHKSEWLQVHSHFARAEFSKPKVLNFP